VEARFDLPRYLSVLPLFQQASIAQLRRVAEGCRLRRLVGGDMVFRAGEECERFHVTVTGQVKLYALSADGQEKVVELAGPGVSFDEAVMFTGRPHIVNAQALKDTLLLTVGKPAVLAEIQSDPNFALRMLAGISHRLQALVRDVEADALHSGLQRVVAYLLRDLPEGHRHVAAPATPPADGRTGPRRRRALCVSLPVSKATIASRLSMTPEYFSRVLHDLQIAGLIRIDKREIEILDARQLAGVRAGAAPRSASGVRCGRAANETASRSVA
jgi:CRP-like cAMP-binding protein